MFSRWIKIIGALASFSLVLSACSSIPTPTETAYPEPASDQPTIAPAGLPNPASVYCEENGGTLDIREGEGGQYGVCIFPDGSECDEWAYFRKECQPGSPEKVVPPSASKPPAVETPASHDNEQVLPSPKHIQDVSYGITFNAPNDYILEAGDHSVIIRREGYSLFIGYQWTDEDPLPFRTGMPAGEFRSAGSIQIGGVDFTKQELVSEGKIKVVEYGPGNVGKLRLVMYLDGAIPDGGTYQDVDISPKVELEFEQIIATIQLGKS